MEAPRPERGPEFVNVRGTDLVLPGGSHGITTVRQRIVSMARGGADRLLVLAVDGVGYELAAETWHPRNLTRLTSTFPSTSVAAWRSAFTGLAPADHGVVGSVSRHGRSGNVVSFLSDRMHEWERSVPILDPDERPHVPVVPTVVDDLLRAGYDVWFEPTSMRDWAPSWTASLVGSASVAEGDAEAWIEAEESPDELVRLALDAGASRLREAGSPAAAFVYLNLDDHLHVHGRDSSVLSALRRLDRAAQELAADGITVVALSDHGQTSAAATQGMADAWASLVTPETCEVPPGGAGRVRWCYPRRHAAPELSRGLQEALGDGVWVGTPEDLERVGLWNLGEAVASNVGSIVVLALRAQFPTPIPGYVVEHGSATPEEMHIPFAVWHGGSHG